MPWPRRAKAKTQGRRCADGVRIQRSRSLRDLRRHQSEQIAEARSGANRRDPHDVRKLDVCDVDVGAENGKESRCDRLQLRKRQAVRQLEDQLGEIEITATLEKTLERP